MGRFSSPLALYDAQSSRFRRLGMDMRRGHEDIARAGLGDMIELTGGRVSQKTLRRLGHPYARGQSRSGSISAANAVGRYTRRRGSSRAKNARAGLTGGAPLLPVNRQSGRLQGSMRLRRVSGGVQSFRVGPTRAAGKSLYGIIPGGTGRVVARGFWIEVKKRWRARNKAFIDEFVRKQRKS